MKYNFPSLMTILFLASTACSPRAGQTRSATSVISDSHGPAPVVLTMASSSGQIQQAMLSSATRWKTIWMDGWISEYAPDGTDVLQSYHEQDWIDPSTARFRVLLSGGDPGKAETFKASDGMTILSMDLKSGQSQSQPLPDFARVGDYVPPLEPGVANPQPLWGQIGTPLSELAFSSDFAQNEGMFIPIGIEPISGRETLIVEWTYIANSLPSWRLWLDTRTAVILKMQDFDKGGGTILRSEHVVKQVAYDMVFADSLFSLPASIPQFSDVSGGSIFPVETGVSSPPITTAQGELYFFTLPHQAGQSAQMVRLPGSCVIGTVSCPQLENVTVPFAFNFNLSALSWSPDGKLAAFAYPDNPNGTPTKLFIFDPAAGTWTALAEFPYIDPPFWSPDGTWIAFRVQDGAGGEDVYAVHRDGTELKNLTATGGLPVEGRPYVMDGWLTENILVRSALPGSQGGIYLLRVSDGAVRPLFESYLTKAAFVISPDNAWLAYDDYDYNSQKHVLKVVEPDGANPKELASFAGGSLYPVIWSPDATRIAFAHSNTDVNFNPISDVYVLGRDGRGVTVVYKGATVGRILFSPDGKFLLVEETTSPTGGHLFAVNLNTLEQHILSAPGLSLDTDWYAPSWRP
jgi:hypothetical protein